MCGIAGVVGTGAGTLADRVHTMITALEHRGPDDHGVVAFDDAVLGNSRLSIIDRAGGHQPLLGPEGSTALVCNGEIYGHKRLRERHSSYPFRSGSDCEVILPLHEKYGEDLLRHLPGTFALALWDNRRRRLILARDRFGERPLYYTVTDDGLLAFASESRALRAGGFTGGEVDPAMVAEMLRQSYIPSDCSIWEGVHQVPHAGRVVWDLLAPPKVQRWWAAPEVRDDLTIAQATDWFSSALDRAVQDQMEADVPLGAFLSGGIDSTTVAALAARHHPDLHAFSFDMPGESELEFARATADMHRMTLHVCRPDTSAITEELLSLADTWDEPFGDSSALPTRLLCRFAREHVTVALTGDGADELLGGYLVWTRDLLEPGTAGSPLPSSNAGPARPARTGLLARLARLGHSDSSRSGASRSEADRCGSTVARRFAAFRQYFNAHELTEMGLPGRDAADVDVSAYHYGTADDISRFDLDHYLPGDILVKTDRASMAFGLEVRSPFLDVEVAEGCLSLPAAHKVDATHEKLLLRRAFSDLWPASVADRRKQGFGSPMATWLALPDVAELKESHLTDPSSALFDLVDHSAVQQYAAANDQRTWNLLMLSMWWTRCRHEVSA